jgi:hypothetical protein
MIDNESMGTLAYSGIVSIGAVIFDPRLGKVDKKNTFYVELDWQDQGREIDPETVKWWEGQPAKAREALYGLDDLPDALKELSDWLPADCKVWGNGPTFDISMLEDAYRQHSIEIPWEFWNIRDCRTIKDLYESSRGGYDKKSGGVLHNALDDAMFQAQYICDMWNKILK